jgi:hypothetical protein
MPREEQLHYPCELQYHHTRLEGGRRQQYLLVRCLIIVESICSPFPSVFAGLPAACFVCLKECCEYGNSFAEYIHSEIQTYVCRQTYPAS